MDKKKKDQQEVEKEETTNEEVKAEKKKEKANPLEGELLETKKQLADTSDKYLRVLAEYDNFRKRSQKERDGIYSDAYVDCVKNMLPIIDNLDQHEFERTP